MKPYIIQTFPWDESSAGQMALHILANFLHKRYPGHVYVSNTTNSPFDIPDMSTYQGNKKDAIAVYPEVHAENPFKCGTVARFLLNLPGAFGGPTSYSKNDMLFIFSEFFNERVGLPEERILTVPIYDLDIFYDMKLERKGKFYYQGKGRPASFIDVPCLGGGGDFIGKEGQKRLSYILNKCELLYSYDSITAMYELARLCGCPVIIMPNEKWSKKECKKVCHYEDGGLGYGLEDEERAVSTCDSAKIRASHKKEEIVFQTQLDSFVKITQGITSLNALNPLLEYLEVHVVDHCNLNCKGCGHYSNLSPPRFADIEVFEKDIERMSSLVSGIKLFRLLGGEPLLHQDVSAFMEIARRYFPDSQIQLVTNGILLPKMDDTFWEACKVNSIEIEVSLYPGIKTQPSVKVLGEMEAKHSVKVIPGPTSRFFAHMNLHGRSDIKKVFEYCKTKMNCPLLDQGKVYICPGAATIDIFNHYFKTNIPKTGWIDIHTTGITGNDILDRINTPDSICGYCDEEFVWFDCENSKKDIEEWVITLENKEIKWKKIGGGSLRYIRGRIIKPNEVFLARLEEIPLSARKQVRAS